MGPVTDRYKDRYEDRYEWVGGIRTSSSLPRTDYRTNQTKRAIA